MNAETSQELGRETTTKAAQAISREKGGGAWQAIQPSRSASSRNKGYRPASEENTRHPAFYSRTGRKKHDL